MSSPTLRLHDFWESGNCYKVRLLLAQLGIPYERVPVDILAGETRTPAFLAKNPNGRVPLVEWPDGRRLAESNAILWHVAEGTPFIAADAFARAELFIHTSTSETYGTARYTPIDEAHPLTGQSPYVSSKIGADKLVESYHLSFGLPAVTLRPFNTYGPRQSARTIIPTIITQSLTMDTIRLGHQEPRRDFTFVGDIIEGFMKAAQTPQALGQEINLGSGRSVSIQELAHLIVGLVGGEREIVTDRERLRPEASEVWHLECDNRRAQEVLHWQPAVSLKEGLQRTVEYIAAHLKRYKSGLYNL